MDGATEFFKLKRLRQHEGGRKNIPIVEDLGILEGGMGKIGAIGQIRNREPVHPGYKQLSQRRVSKEMFKNRPHHWV